MAARKERKKRRASRNEPLGPMYPPGTPVNEATGLPEAEGEISVETAERVGFDPVSARKRAQFKRQVERRAGGEKNVKWNADPRLKYLQIVQVHPSAFMTVKQISPHTDDSLDDQSVKAMPTLGHLKAFVKENHWKGDKATYVYEAWDAANNVIGEGEFNLGADPEWAERKEEEMARRGQPPNPQYPPQQGGYQQPPQGGYPGQQYPPQGYYPPPQGYAYPPPGYGQPQTTVVMPHPIQPQAPMPQAPPANADTNVFLQYLIAQVEWSRQEIARLSAQPQVQQPQGADPQQWLAWHNAERQRWEAEQAAKVPVAPPVPPPTPLEQMQSTINMIKAVTSARETLVGVGEPKEDKKKEEDDGFPIAVRQVGPIRIIADKKTGQIIKDPVMSAMFNADNLEDGFNRLFKKAEGLMKDRAADNSAQLDKSLELEKAKQANIREKADLVRSIADGEEKMARARQMVNSMPVQREFTPPNPITQVQAEKIAERPTVMAEVQPVKPAYVPPPPPWRVNPQQDFSPAERPASSSETRPGQVDTPGKIQPEHRNESPEDPEGNGSGPVVSAGEEIIPDTEPPPALPEPAPEPTELQTN